jgi:hypothetical protein
MRWAGHVACMGKVYTGLWWERDHLEDLGIGGKIILKWIFKKIGEA